MKRLLTILLSVLLTANFLSCGGGGVGSSGSSTGTIGKTEVTINLGETKTVSKAGGLKSTSSIPAAIASIKFTISAPDMATIVRVVTLVGGTAISETFEVPSGSNRHFVAEALDASGNVLFKGDTYADLTGTSADLTIAMISVEDIAPVFSGLSNITSVTTTAMVLSWSAATDNVTPTDKIQYLIYLSATPGGQDFTNPNFVTIPGATTFALTGLNPDTTYYIVVRAKDERGNVDENTVEKAVTTVRPPDTTAPEYAGIISASALSETMISLTWNPASDDRTAASDIIYLIYMATSSHGQNLVIPSFTITGTTSHRVTGLNPGTTYYFIVRAKDSAGNIDNNTVEKSATTLTPPPPNVITIQGCVVYDGTELPSPLVGATVSTSLDSQTTTTGADGCFFLQTITTADGSYPCNGESSYTVTATYEYTKTQYTGTRDLCGDHRSNETFSISAPLQI